jgi:hypothetical protein
MCERLILKTLIARKVEDIRHTDLLLYSYSGIHCMLRVEYLVLAVFIINSDCIEVIIIVHESEGIALWRGVVVETRIRGATNMYKCAVLACQAYARGDVKQA